MWLLFADAELRSGVLGTLAAHKWLGFDQDQSQAYPLQWFEGHPTQRGWSKHELKTLGLRLNLDPGQKSTSREGPSRTSGTGSCTFPSCYRRCSRRGRDTSPCLDRADRDGSIGKKPHAFRWCHSLNRLIDTRLGLSGLIYASYHRARERPAVLAHDGCHANNCVAHHVADTALYMPKHRFNGCKCKSVIPPFNRISEVLSLGSFPLIDARLPPYGVSIVVRCKSNTTFLAFSHVRSNGRGGTSEQGLQLCPFAFFFCKMIRWVWRREHAKTHPLFWIDSLCIPAQDDLRTVSTHLMSKIYCDVIYTSVLDQAWPSARGTTERHAATVVHFRLCLDATNLDLERGALCQKPILLFRFWHCC